MLLKRFLDTENDFAIRLYVIGYGGKLVVRSIDAGGLIGHRGHKLGKLGARLTVTGALVAHWTVAGGLVAHCIGPEG